MATLQHNTLPSSAVHEPKHITTNGVSASGKVITNSGSTASESEYRFLTRADLQELQENWHVLEINASVNQTHYIPTLIDGDIVQWGATVNSAIATATNSYELQIDGVSVTGSGISLTITPGTGGTAGDQVNATPSAANSFTAGQSISIVHTATGNTDAGVDVRFVLLIERSE
jgi:hypothetical protein